MKATFAVVKIKLEKNSRLYEIWTHDLYDTGAVLYQLSWQANWKLEIMLVRNKTLISGLTFTIA